MSRSERLKMRFVKWLDKNPDYCWSNLVHWVLGYEDFWSLLWPWHADYSNYKCQMCRESHKDSYPYAYCGKCERTGRYYDVTKKPKIINQDVNE